jgi:hypothetical protein
MQPILAPIRPDERSANVANLQVALGLLGFAVTDAGELKEQRAGALTRRAVLSFQARNNLRATDQNVLDQPTADVLNKLLGGRGLLDVPDRPAQLLVHGTVRNALGQPQAGLLVLAFDVDLRNRELLGRTQTNAQGQYEIGYSADQFKKAEKASADLLVQVLDATGAVRFESPDILFNAPPIATLDVTLDGGTYQGPTEYDLLLQALAPTLGDIAPGDLQQDEKQAEITFVARDAEQPYERVALLVNAHRIGQQTKISPVFLYGVLRQQPASPLRWLDAELAQNPTAATEAAATLRQLQLLSPAYIESLFQAAVAQNTVPALSEKELKQIREQLAQLSQLTALPSLAPIPAPKSVGDLLRDRPDRSAVADELLKDDRLTLATVGAEQDELRQIAAPTPEQQGRFAALADVSAALKVTSLAAGHAALLDTLHTELGAVDATAGPKLAAFSADDWAQRIGRDPNWAQAAGLGAQAPPTPAALATYAQQLVRRTEYLFPTATVAARLPQDKVFAHGAALGTLLSQHPDFDLKTTPADTLLRAAKVAPAAAQELKTMQRVYRLADSYRATSALVGDGLHSAQAVYFMGREAFQARYADHPDIGPKQAKRIFNRAKQVYATGVKLLGDSRGQLGAGRIRAIGGPAAAAPVAPEQFPNLKILFETTDQCECEQCRAVTSPAAYLVDCLRFLTERNSTDPAHSVKDILFQRRPDIGWLDLTCANTNTALPYIDLVCERLEQRVAELPSATLPAALVPQLLDGPLAPAVLAAFRQPANVALVPVLDEAVVQTLIPAQAWIVRDRLHTYHVSVAGSPAGLQVVELPQTHLSSAELNANAEYVNTKAYDALKAAPYPLQLPFDLYTEEVNAYLPQLGLRRFELMQAFQPMQPTWAEPTASDITAAYFGLNASELQIIATDLALPAALPTLATYWTGDAALSEADLVSAVQPLLVFIARTGLVFSEVQQLLALPLLGPAGALFIDTSASECDTAQMKVAGLTGAGLATIHRLVRLWRRVGWSMGELSRAIIALNGGALDAALLPCLQALAELRTDYGLSVDQLISLYTDIPTTSDAIDTYSLYDTLFQNRSVTNPVDEDLAASALPAGPLAADHQGALLAGLGVAAADLAALGLSDATVLSLGGLSAAYRQTLLAGLLGQSVADFQVLRQLVPTDPFGLPPSGTQLFIQQAQRLLGSGYSLSALAYLLLNQDSATTPNAPGESAIGAFLLALRTSLQAVVAQQKIDSAASDTTGELTLPYLSKLPGYDEATLDQLGRAIGGELPAADRHALLTALGTLLGITFTLADFDPITTTDAGEIAVAKALRFGKILQAVSDYQVKKATETAVVQAVAQQVGLDEKTTLALLTTLQLDGEPLLRHPELAALVLSPADVPTTAASFPQLHRAVRWLAKCALVIAPYKLKPADVDWLLAHAPALGWLSFQALDAGAPGFAAWLALDRAMQYRRLFPDTSEIGLLGLLAQTLLSAPNPADFEAGLAKLTGWPAAQLAPAIAQLAPAFPADYASLAVLDRLVVAVRWLGKSSLTVASTQQLLPLALTAAESQLVKQTLRSRYDASQWLDLSKQLQDKVRGQKRDALVAYLLAQNPALWQDANDLYAYFLVDVQMESVMPTSRVVQASGAIQLFVQRCLMNLEPAVRADDPAWTQWKWMKNYRVWEANRKIFLYPENWIEPELRLDKSVFFKELENDLLQNELNSDNAETAFLAYLDKLETVARLEIVGQFYEAETRLLHVIGRTYGTEPHQYFYRRWVEGRHWTAWEKVEVDITGDHLVPLVINNRLHLYWLVFTEEVEEQDTVQLPSTYEQQHNSFSPSKNRSQLQIQVATSEYKCGKWAPKKLSIDTVSTGFSPYKVDRTQLNLLPADLLASIGRYYLLVGRQVEKSGEYQYIGIFDIIGCHGVPERVEEYASVLLTLPMTARSRYANTLLRESQGDGSLVFTKGMLPFTNQPILAKTPGTFRVLASEQLSQFDQVAQQLLVKVLARAAQANPAAAASLNRMTSFGRLPQRQLWLTLGTGLPFFYQDRTRTFFAIPEVVSVSRSRPRWAEAVKGKGDRRGDQLKLRRLVKGRLTIGDRYNFTEWDGQLNKWFKAQGINQDWDEYLLGLFDDPATQGKVDELLKKAMADYLKQPLVAQLRFANYYHPHVCLLKKELYRGGIEGLMQRDVQLLAPTRFPTRKPLDFKAEYGPTALVDNALEPSHYPQEDLDFDADGSYALYNWELFFHAPLLIANQLSRNQQFEEAMRWYHFIFNPTLRASLPPAAPEPVPQRYWLTKPFFERLAPDYVSERIDRVLLLLSGHDKAATDAVTEWRNHPFEPHLIAQGRRVAYQQTVVMKYLDNLLAWGDQLFRRGTMESLGEATQLYVMAAELLGPRPLQVPKTKPAVVASFNQLAGQVDTFGNALIDLENSIVVDADNVAETDADGDLLPRFDLYFCPPANDKVLGYWDTLANRLFNLRNGKNIDGLDAIPALFAPPIDPAMLVRATAAGLDIGSVLSELNAPLPFYRFAVLAQKAAELANEVKVLGSALLSALEKRDAESMALLRAGLEMKTLDAVRVVKDQQIKEAQAGIEGIRRSRQLTETRLAYYKSLAKGSATESLSSYEQQHLSRMSAAQDFQLAGQALQLTASVVGLVPNIRVGASGFGGSPVADVSFGGIHLSSALRGASEAMSFLGAVANADAAKASTLGGHARRWDDWQHQITLATKELAQLDQQILTAQIRESGGPQARRKHHMQIANAQKTDEQMRTKFTNRELYDWMVTQLSASYFQGYQLAFDVAKKAERCLRFELGLADSAYIQFGYWDSLKKGLLSGEKLHQDLKRMEVAYHDQNRREYEISKHVSLALLNPLALLRLQQTGDCFFDLPETLFDFDFPGHYLRRIKSVSLSLPCVVGPYTGVNATLTLTKSSIRTKNTLLGGSQYARTASPDNQPADDARFRDSAGAVQSVAISGAQGDAGLFELSFRDERYLPFEGQGVISSWHLQLNQAFRQFDYATLADVILHVKYTAREGGEQLKQGATSRVAAVLADFTKQLQLDKSEKGLFRLFSLRQDFPDQWHRFLFPANPADPQQLTLDFAGRFPYFTIGHTLRCTRVELLAEAPAPIGQLTFTPAGPEEVALAADGLYGALLHYRKDQLNQSLATPWTLRNTADTRLSTTDLSDLLLLIQYELS